jgi:lipoprotein-anchoring transpeptidase ErfK/SrfK
MLAAPTPATSPITIPATQPALSPLPLSPVADSRAPRSTTAPATLPAGATTLPALTIVSTTLPTTLPTTNPTFNLSGAAALTEAQTDKAAGNLVQARALANHALQTGQLSVDEEAAARKLASDINQILVFSPRKIPNDPWADQYSVQPGETLEKIAPRYDLTWPFVQHINKISDPKRLRYGVNLKLVKGPFHAVVTKSRFTIDIYLGAPGGPGSLYVCTFPVGLGQDDSTPTGTWEVAPHRKLVHPQYFDPRGGGLVYDAMDPKNPLGEFWIGLTGTDGDAVGKQSYGIHGTIEQDSIGKQSSMGCVRLRKGDIDQVYEMLVEGKSVVIVKP